MELVRKKDGSCCCCCLWMQCFLYESLVVFSWFPFSPHFQSLWVLPLYLLLIQFLYELIFWDIWKISNLIYEPDLKMNWSRYGWSSTSVEWLQKLLVEDESCLKSSVDVELQVFLELLSTERRSASMGIGEDRELKMERWRQVKKMGLNSSAPKTANLVPLYSSDF